MKVYKPKEFAEKINVSINTLQRWDREGTLKVNIHPSNRRFYTEEQYKNYLKKIGKKESLEINFRIRKESDIFLIEVKNLKTEEYVEINSVNSYEDSINFVNEKKEEYDFIGIDVNVIEHVK